MEEPLQPGVKFENEKFIAELNLFKQRRRADFNETDKARRMFQFGVPQTWTLTGGFRCQRLWWEVSGDIGRAVGKGDKQHSPAGEPWVTRDTLPSPPA